MAAINVKIALFNRNLDQDLFDAALPALQRARASSASMKAAYDRAVDYWVTKSQERSLGESNEEKENTLKSMFELLKAAYPLAANEDERSAIIVIFANVVVFSPCD